jgi:hypothetical protein
MRRIPTEVAPVSARPGTDGFKFAGGAGGVADQEGLDGSLVARLQNPVEVNGLKRRSNKFLPLAMAWVERS